MTIKKTTWFTFILSAILSLGIWLVYSYPQLAFVNLTVDRQEALTIAKSHLNNQNINIDSYRTAATIGTETYANRYLQKTVGFKGLKSFALENDFDLFFWHIRFFKEGQKEEFRVTVSSESGEIIGYAHIIEETESRADMEKDEARKQVMSFLTNMFGTDFENYSLKGDLSNVYENRTDYSFTWEKKGVKIPWSEEEGSGNGRLLTGAKISGGEVLSFSKNTFSIPEKFNRDLAKRSNIGANLYQIIKNFYIAIIVAAVFFIVSRRNHLAMHSTKKFYLWIMGIAAILILASKINFIQDVFYNFRTTSSLIETLARYANNALLSALFTSMILIIPSLSGELLHLECFKDKREGRFLHYVQTTFFSRNVAEQIWMGYLICIILFGLQSLIIQLGQNYLGVWTEYTWMGQLSTAYLPFLAAFTVGFKASFSEEIMYRLFAISWAKKLFKNTFIAVLISSLIFGFAHSTYPVYPMWFRGIEVTLLGLFISFAYLRFGIITVIVAHFLFDVFWSISSYILGQSQAFHFYSSIFVLLIPMIWAFIAYWLNRPVEVKPLRWHFNKHQQFNLNVLRNYMNQHRDEFNTKDADALKKEIASHGWDIAVVDVAVNEFIKEMS